jgi:hypothetical protein
MLHLREKPWKPPGRDRSVRSPSGQLRVSGSDNGIPLKLPSTYKGLLIRLEGFLVKRISPLHHNGLRDTIPHRTRRPVVAGLQSGGMRRHGAGSAHRRHQARGESLVVATTRSDLFQSHRGDGLPPLVIGTGTFSNLYDESANVTDNAFLRITRLSLRYGANAFDTGKYSVASSALLSPRSSALPSVRDHPRQGSQGSSGRVPSGVVPNHHQDGQVQPDAQGSRPEREYDATLRREELEAIRDGLP